MNLNFTDYSVGSMGQEDGYAASPGVRDVAAPPLDVERWSSLDALPSQVAVVDHQGIVRWVNTSWVRGAAERQGRLVESAGVSFAHACSRALGFGPEASATARDGLRAVLAGSKPAFEFECAHHPRGSEAWSSVTVTPCEIDGRRGALVQLVDVTDVHQADRRRVVARAVARAMGADGARREMLRDVITQVCAAMNWCVAARWSWDRAAGALRCDAVYSQRPDGSRGWGTLSNAEGLASRVWATRCPQWSDSLEREDAAVVKTVLGAQSAQIVEAIGVPVGHAGHADGVVVFYSTHDHRPEAALLDMLSSLLVGGRWMPSSLVASSPREAPVAPTPARDAFASIVDLAAASLCTVLLTGEGGTGKARAAREIHAASARARGPFVECDCASLTAHEFEAELFGYEADVLPESKRARRGLLEQAAGGTLVLREVGALDAASQAKLLKVLETHVFQRLGDAQERSTDVRVIATSTRDLRAPGPRKAAFSDKLLQRLSSLVVAVPALRSRNDGLDAITRAVLTELARQYNRRAPALGADAAAVLAAHAWPGNVRELRNVLERAWLGVGDTVTPEAITAAIHGHLVPAANEVAPIASEAPPAPAPRPTPRARAPRPAPRATVEEVAQHAPATLLGAIDPTALTLADVERAHIERVLVQTGFNMRRAAAALDISRSTLYLRAKHYRLNVTRSRQAGTLGVENDNDATEFETDTDTDTETESATGT